MEPVSSDETNAEGNPSVVLASSAHFGDDGQWHNTCHQLVEKIEEHDHNNQGLGT
jgi:hypothetical protein